MKERIHLAITVTIVTCVIGLAVSYITQLFPVLPKLNFLEAVGLYCIWTPIHNLLTKGENE